MSNQHVQGGQFQLHSPHIYKGSPIISTIKFSSFYGHYDDESSPLSKILSDHGEILSLPKAPLSIEQYTKPCAIESRI